MSGGLMGSRQRSGDGERPPARPWQRRLHLVTLSSFAVAQPLFDLIARAPEFLVAHDLTPGDILLFALLLSLGVPSVVLACGALIQLISARAAAAFELLVIAALVAIVVLPVLGRAGPGWLASAMAVAAGAGATWCLRRWPPVSSWLTLLAPAVVAFPLLFLLASPVRGLLVPAEVEVTATTLGSGPPVVLVIFDELPVTSLMNEAHELDALRFPGFAELARSSTWFRDATTVSPNTNGALPAILTGRLPDRWRLPTYAEHPDNLFTAFAASYDLKVVETSTRMCPDELNLARAQRPPFAQRHADLLVDAALAYLRLVTPSDLAAELPPVSSSWRDFAGGSGGGDDPHARANDSEWVARYFTDQVVPTSRPTVYFLHVNVPHPPWKYLPSGRQHGPLGLPSEPHGLVDMVWSEDEWAVLQVWQRHLLQTQYADRLLAGMMTRLRAAGLFDRAMVVVASDHGAAFVAGEPRRDITRRTAPDLLSTLLLVKWPGQREGGVSSRVAQSIDILPTVAEAAGLTLPWAVDGQSLSDPERPPRRVELMFNHRGEAIAPLSTTRDEKYRTLRQMVDTFGSGAKANGLFAFGPYGALVASRAADHPRAPGSGLTAVLEQGWALDRVDPDSAFVPCHLEGRLHGLGGEAGERFLAVEVNGVIQATTRTYDRRGGGARFTAMIPETSLVAGTNRVELYLVDGEPGAVTLAPVRLEPSVACRLVGPAADQVVECTDGWREAVVPLAVRGKAFVSGRSANGWAADILGGVPASRILVFRGREMLLEAPTGVYRWSFAERDPRLAYCGFEFHLQESTVAVEDLAELRFFAVVGDKVSALHVVVE